MTEGGAAEVIADQLLAAINENIRLIAQVRAWRAWFASGEAPSPSEWRELDRILAAAGREPTEPESTA